MSFITPTFLFAAGAALLPVLYHLIRKMRARKVRFSSLLFLRATPKALIKRRRIRDILLMIVRACILGLLAFVFARPFFPRESLPVALQASDTSTVILIDNSYSMRYGDRFERAKEEALDIIGDADAADEISVVVFSDHAEQVTDLTNDFALLRNIVGNTLSAGYRTTDLYQPFRLAGEILGNAKHERRAIVLISDFQEGGWNSRLDSWRAGDNTTFIPIRIDGDHIENSYISQLVIEQRRIGDAESAQFRLQVQSDNAREGDDREVTLWLNGRETGHSTAEAVRTRQLFFQEDNLREGNYQGYLALDDDNLEADNYRYFTFPVSRRPSILCIDGSPGGSRSNAFFLGSIFDMGERTLYEFASGGMERIAPQYLAGHDVVYLTNMTSLTDTRIEAIEDFMANGGGVVISFGDGVNIEQASRTLERLGIGTVTGRVDVRVQRSIPAMAGDIDLRHPVFSVFSVSGSGDLSRPRFREYVTVVPDSSAAVIARYDTGDPFLIERVSGTGRILVMTSSLNTEWSDFPVNDVFLPFVYQLTKYALASSNAENSFIIGDQVMFHGAPGHQWEVRTPDGRIVRVTIDESGDGWFRDTGLPGNYQAAHDGDQRFFSVNVDTRESDLTARDAEELYAAISGGSGGDGERAVEASVGAPDDDESRQKLWRAVLLVIIALFMFETFLANRRMSINFGDTNGK